MVLREIDVGEDLMEDRRCRMAYCGWNVLKSVFVPRVLRVIVDCGGCSGFSMLKVDGVEGYCG
jgi:hypothetical protein